MTKPDTCDRCGKFLGCGLYLAADDDPDETAYCDECVLEVCRNDHRRRQASDACPRQDDDVFLALLADMLKVVKDYNARITDFLGETEP